MSINNPPRMIVAPGEKYDGDIMCHYSSTLILYHLHRTPFPRPDFTTDPPTLPPVRKVYYETYHRALDATVDNADGTTNTYRVWAADDITEADMLRTINNANPDKLQAVENAHD